MLRLGVTYTGLASLLLLVAGVALFASWKPAAAQGGETVTTELQPGWNLAGWTEFEAPVSAIFEAIPQLDFVYAWDAEDRRFRVAVRTDTGPQGDLTTLTPGMGLVLWLEGDESFAWTRPLIPHAGGVFLQRGWNLVVWAGEDGIATTDALRRIEDLVTEVADAAGDAPAVLATGDAFWLRLSVDKPWWQGDEFPEVEFASEFSPQEQATLRGNLDEVVVYFAQRFGMVPPGRVVRFGDDYIDACAHYAHPAIVLKSTCAGALAHEYAHALQHAMATLSGQPVAGRWAPAWIGEGGANHWSAQYRAWQAGVSGVVDLTSPPYLGAVVATALPLRDMETYDRLLGRGGSYSVAQFGVDWLASVAGPESVRDYYLERYRYGNWQAALRAAFGISHSAFYREFEKHRAEVAPPLPQLQALVLGADGTELEDVIVSARDTMSGRVALRWTDDTGRADVPLEAGTYELSLRLGECPLEWTSADARLEAADDQGVLFEMDATDLDGVVLRLAGDHAVPCGTLKGVVVDPDGERRKGVTVQVRSADGEQPRSRRTSGTGEFEWTLPRGDWELSILLERCSLTWSSGVAGLEDRDGKGAAFSLEKADLEELELKLATDSLDHCPRVWGVVQGPDGAPQPGVTVRVSSLEEDYPIRRTTSREGTFESNLEAGSYELALSLDGCLLEWSGSGLAFEGTDAGAGQFSVRDVGVTSMTLTLPEAATEQCPRFEGVVTGPDGSPQEGVRVRVQDEATGGYRYDTTDSHGGFRFTLRPGPHELVLYHEWCPLDWSSSDPRLETLDARKARFLLSSDGLAGVGLALPEAAPMQCPRFEVVVLDPDGTPQEGVTVRVQNEATGGARHRTTNREGMVGQALERGAYKLSLFRFGCPLEWSSSARRLETIDTRTSRFLLTGGPLTAVVLTLLEAAAEQCPAFEGVVLGSDGEPQEGVRLRIEDKATGGFRYADTNDEGSFSTALGPGSYELSLTFGGCPLEWSSTDDRLETVDTRKASLTVSSNPIAGLVLVLLDAPSEQCPTFKGAVLGSDGSPQEGVTVRIRDEATGGFRSARTNDEGSFDIALEEGAYDLSLWLSGCLLDWSSSDPRLETVDARTARFAVPGITTGSLVLELPEPATEQCPRFEAVVVGPDGAPQAGLILGFRSEATGGYRYRTTNSEGSLAVTLERGAYELTAVRNWCPLAWSSSDRRLETVDARKARFSMSGEAVTGVVLVLPEAAAEQCPRFEGLVTGPDGIPLEGVTVRFKAETTGGVRTRTTKSDGRFDIALERGAYEISVSRDACSLEWSSSDPRLQAVDARKARVVLSGGDITGMVLRIPAGAEERCLTFEGVVVGPDGAPQEGVRVRIRDESTGGSRYVTTGSEGHLAMTLERGTYSVWLYRGQCPLNWTTSDAGFEALDARTMRLVVSSDENSSVVLTLPRAAREQCLKFEGVVVGPDGSPQQGVRVGIRDESTRTWRYHITDGEGSFGTALRQGAHVLSLTLDWCPLEWSSPDSRLAFPQRHRARVVLDTSDVTGVVLTLPAPARELCPTIAGTVADLGGRPRAGVQVTLGRTRRVTEASVEYTSQTLSTGADGRFSKRVPRGTYRISIRVRGLVGYYGGAHGFATSVAQAAAVNAVASDVTGIVIPYGFIRGTVKSLDGQRVFGARVGIDSVSSWRVSTTGDGSFQLPVPRGTHQLAVTCQRGGPVWYRSEGGHTLRTEEATSIAVGSNDRSGFDIVVPATHFDIIQRGCPSLPDVTRGVVVGPDGSPRRGLRLKLTDLSAPIRSEERSTYTTPEGSFRLQELSSPDYLYLRLRPETTCVAGLAADGEWIAIGLRHGNGFRIAADLPRGVSVKAPHPERLVIRIPDPCPGPTITLPPPR